MLSLIRESVRNPNVRVIHRIQQRIITTVSAKILEHHDEGEEGDRDDEGQHDPVHGCPASLSCRLHDCSPPPERSRFNPILIFGLISDDKPYNVDFRILTYYVQRTILITIQLVFKDFYFMTYSLFIIQIFQKNNLF